MLEAFIRLNTSKKGSTKPVFVWQSLGVFEMRENYRQAGFDYDQAAEHWRKRAEREYGRKIELRKIVTVQA